MTVYRSLPSVARGAIEIALNRVLADDKRALARCAALAGKTLEMRFSDLALVITFIAERNGMQVRGVADQAADVSLTGAATVFGRIVLSGNRESLIGGGLRIEGDVGVAQRFADLFSGIDFDLADILDARLGPVPAYVVNRGLRSMWALGRRAAPTLAQHAAEYLREETRDVVGTWEYERFVDEVETLRDDVERLAARVRRLGSP